VDQTRERAQYQLNEQMLAVAARSLASSQLLQYGRSILGQLSEATNLNSYIAVLDGRRTVLLATAKGRLGQVYDFQVGLTHPAHATAGGKLMLAHLDPAELQGVYPPGIELRRYTPQTLGTVEELQEQFERIRLSGFASDDREHLPHWRGVAAPVRNANGRVIAAVIVGGSIERVVDPEMISLREEVIPLAAELSRFIGAEED
jgi:DNA-binding IclR family transcriptional regulator